MKNALVICFTAFIVIEFVDSFQVRFASFWNNVKISSSKSSPLIREFAPISSSSIRRELYCSKGEDNADFELEAIYDNLVNKMRGTSIYLVGMMGSGKSSVGDDIAKGLSYRFLDTDEIAEFMCEMPIVDYFASEDGGEEAFRELEYKILMELGQYTRTVVSTGGGIVMKQENWGLLHHGIVVFLDMAPADILERLKSDDASEIKKRPLLKGSSDPLAKLESLRSERIEQYRQADITIPISKTLSRTEVAALVANQIVAFIDSNPPAWQKWKTEKEAKAKQQAQIMNPQTIPEGDRKNGSIEFINLSDIELGNVQLPKSDEEKKESR